MILLILVGLILGGLFLKYFKRIDTALFGKTTENYEPFGLVTVLICMLSGALIGGAAFLNEIFNAHWPIKSIETCSAMITISALSYAVYAAIARMGSLLARIGKTFFMLFSCAIGMLVGALGSVVAIVLVILVLLLYIVGGMLTSKSDSRTAYNQEADELNWEREQMKGRMGRSNVSKEEVFDLGNRIRQHNQRSGKDLLG